MQQKEDKKVGTRQQGNKDTSSSSWFDCTECNENPFSFFIRFYQNTQHSTCFRQQSLTLMVTGARWRWWLRFLLATFTSSLPPPLNSQDSDMGFRSPTTQFTDRFGFVFFFFHGIVFHDNPTWQCCHANMLPRSTKKRYFASRLIFRRIFHHLTVVCHFVAWQRGLPWTFADCVFVS